MDIRIPILNAFKLRITGNITSGTHTETADMNVVRNLIVNFVRRGRIFQAHGIDVEGRIVILNLGTLPSGTYGVELVGYYNGEPWRFFQKDVFEIVRQNSDATPAGSGDVPTYDVSFELNFGGESVSAEYVDAVIAAHDADEQAHADIREALQTLETELRQEIAEAGEVNDVQIDGQSILDPETKVANIDSSQFGKVDDVEVNGQSVLDPLTKKVSLTIPMSASAEITMNDPTAAPEANAVIEDGVIKITLKNIKGEKGDTGATGPQGLQGVKGDSAVWDETSDLFVNMAHEMGDSELKVMSQKSVTAIVGNLQATNLKKEIDTNGFIKPDASKLLPLRITSAGKWADGWSFTIPIGDAKKVTIYRTANSHNIAFLRDYSFAVKANDLAMLSDVEGYNTVLVLDGDSYVTEFDIPSDAKYLCICMTVSHPERMYPFIMFDRPTVANRLAEVVASDVRFKESPLSESDGTTITEIISGSFLWGTMNNRTSILWSIDPSKVRKIKVHNHRSKIVPIWFLADNIVVSGVRVNLAMDSTRQEIGIDDTVVLDVPLNCHYICANKNYDGVPGDPQIYLSETPQETVERLHTPLASKVERIESEMTSPGILDYSEYDDEEHYLDGWVVLSSNKWSNVGSSYVIPMPASTPLKITRSASGVSVFGFLSDINHVSGEIASFAGEKQGVYYMKEGQEYEEETIEVTSPNVDCYLYVTEYGSNSSTTPSRLPKIELPQSSIKSMKRDISSLQSDVAELKEGSIVGNKYNLSKLGIGKDNEIIGWWFFPQAIVTTKYRNKLIWGWCDDQGQTGVGEMDLRTKEVKKNILKKIDEKDDHNACFVFELPNGYIGVGYHGNHAGGSDDSAVKRNRLHIRKSLFRDSIDEFGQDTIIQSNGKFNYGQCFYMNGEYHIFARYNQPGWQYTKSSDFENWSSPIPFVKTYIAYKNASRNFYMRVQKVLGDDNILRLCMYEHPDWKSDIRMGFLDVTTGDVYNADGETYMGNINELEAPLSFMDFEIVVNRRTDSGYSQIRLFDVAVTPKNETIIAVGDWKDDNDTTYCIVRNGEREEICAAGNDILSDYPLGMAIIDANNVVVARGTGSGGARDIVEIRSYENGSWVVAKEIYNEIRQATNKSPVIRNFRPFVSDNGKFILWCRGWYSGYDDGAYTSDIMIYDVDNDKVY